VTLRNPHSWNLARIPILFSPSIGSASIASGAPDRMNLGTGFKLFRSRESRKGSFSSGTLCFRNLPTLRGELLLYAQR
jgi:hypothetical protein